MTGPKCPHAAGIHAATAPIMQGARGERQRLLEKLLRELSRSEEHAIDHASREAKRIGETAPVLALRDVAAHALAMRPRFQRVIDGHALPAARGGLGATLSMLRQILSERIHDAERAYRSALFDLRHGLDVVQVIRELARLEELFALIRWCDDWLIARRTLVARVEAQLNWFADQALESALRSEEPTLEDSSEGDQDDPSAWFDRPRT
jgi:hypothetical protein